MIAISPVKPKLTLEDFLSLPETKPYSEYVDGKVEQKPMLQGEHTALSRPFYLVELMKLANPAKLRWH